MADVRPLAEDLLAICDFGAQVSVRCAVDAGVRRGFGSSWAAAEDSHRDRRAERGQARDEKRPDSPTPSGMARHGPTPDSAIRPFHRYDLLV